MKVTESSPGMGHGDLILRTFTSQFTVVLKIIQPHLLFLMTSVVNKSCNIECCVKSMLLINQNMIVCQGLELVLSTFIIFQRKRGLNNFENFGPIPKSKEADLI